MTAERLTAVFARKKRILVTYLCVGDPSVEESVAIARACVDAGADVLELGVPFSDPTADGPTIARASLRALRAGGGLGATLRAARALRDGGCVAPIVLFGYYNPLFVRGDARAVDDAAAAGVDALLVVDLPSEEGAELRARARERGLAVIPLVAPTSSPARIEAARAEKPPFVYYVSMTGVTGSADAPLAEAGRAAGALRAQVGVPVVVGFGIDSAAKARAAAAGGADGIVVGTALVKRIEAAPSPEKRIEDAVALVRELGTALSLE